MRHFFIALACLTAAACDQVQLPDLQNLAGGAAGGSNDRLRPAELQGFLEQGMIWCYGYDPTDQSCRQIERLSQVDRTGFTIDKYFLLPLDAGRTVLKVEAVQRVRFEHDGAAFVCASVSQELQTMRFYQMQTTEASISSGEQAIPDDLNARLIQIMADEQARAGSADEVCFGWRVASRDPWDLVELDFVDGVQQPEEEPSVVRLFPIGSNFLRLRPPNS
ncbi:MAG: hypothetical protein K2X34_06775 [Hyphomonadaceae bacterium]|nr:hypothetical protein [Hyphomonadaceae bacterium]